MGSHHASPSPRPRILVTYQTAVVTCQSCFRYGKSGILANPPKQGLTSVVAKSVLGNLALCPAVGAGGGW